MDNDLKLFHEKYEEYKLKCYEELIRNEKDSTIFSLLEILDNLYSKLPIIEKFLSDRDRKALYKARKLQDPYYGIDFGADYKNGLRLIETKDKPNS